MVRKSEHRLLRLGMKYKIHCPHSFAAFLRIRSNWITITPVLVSPVAISNSKIYQKSYSEWFLILYAQINLSKDQEEKKKFKPKSNEREDPTANPLGSQDLESKDKNSRLQQQKQREIDQQNISPEEIIEEEEKRQPQTTQE